VVVDGKGRIALVHRPKYDDWSLPKGKLDPGEGFEEAGLREVEEEIGVRCRLVGELPSTQYRDAKGRQKLVRYWLMEPVTDGGFEPTSEIDELRWLSPDEAAAALSYERDREVLEAALDAIRQRASSPPSSSSSPRTVGGASE
jgi:8-oxo-dGTP diphosphatase